MKSLNEYVAENRKDENVTFIEGCWYGEIYVGIRAGFYDVPTNSGIKKAFAFISYPKTEKPENGYPAVLLIHGGNGAAFYETAKIWADRGFVAIAPDFNGKYATSINERQLINTDGGNAGYGSVSDLYDEHTWAYFSVLSAMRAIDVLEGMDVVDKNNIFSCGLSWGGFIQLLLSSVENRIRAASVIYSSAYVMQSEWGENVLSKLTEEDKKRWIQYIDPHNYLQNIAHPVFFTAGADDHAFKMENRRMTAEAISSPVYFGLRKSFPHGNFYGFEQMESAQFFMSFVNGTSVPQPQVFICNGYMRATAGQENSSLSLCFTKEDVEAADRQEWEEISLKSGEKLPLPLDCTALFITEKTVDGLLFSSNMIKVRQRVK